MDNLNFSHGGDIYKYKKELIDFSANINPLVLTKKIKNIILKNIDKIEHYPDISYKEIKKGIAKFWKIKEENILVGNGSLELIYLVVSALKPKKVLIPVPTFSEYERAAKLARSKIEFLKLLENKGFSLNTNFQNKADIIFLCNPNNPTGNLIIQNKNIIKNLQSKFIIIDETCMDFLEDQEERTLIWEAIRSKNLIVLRTFTKFFALPGLRIGYLVANSRIIDKLAQYQIPWNVNCFAQIVAQKALQDKNYIKRTRVLIKKERNFLFHEISKIPDLKPYPSVTNFILIKIERKNLTSKTLKEKLIKYGILIRDCSNFRNLNNKFIRIAVLKHSENIKLINSLKKILCKI
jgi:threonine-phosphate decarboxylase